MKLRAHTKVLQEEVRILENLSHPKIVRCLGTEREDETFDYAVGIYSWWIHTITIGEIWIFLSSCNKKFHKAVVAGSRYLHIRGIIHGDIKGANTLVGSKGRIKL